MNPLKKKVIILLDVHMDNIETTGKQCKYLLSKYISRKQFRIVKLKGNGRKECVENDIRIVGNLRNFIKVSVGGHEPLRDRGNGSQ